MKKFLLKCGIFSLPIAAVLLPAYTHLHVHGELYAIEEMARMSQGEDVLVGLAYTDPMHLVKMSVLKERQPEVVALGSSRVLPFREVCFLKPKLFYNCGRTVGKVEDMNAFVSAYPGEKPQLIILGLDQDFFMADDEDKAPIARSYDLKDSSYGTRVTKGTKALFDAFKKGEVETGDCLPNTGGYLGRNARLYNEGYRSDGSYRYGRVLRSDDGDKDYEFVRTIQRIEKKKGRFAPASSISQRSVRELSLFLEICKGQGIHVVGFLPPYAGKVYDRFRQEQKSYPHIFHLHGHLKPLFEAEGMKLLDCSDIRSLGANDFETKDGFHGSEVSYLKLLKRLTIADSVVAGFVDEEKLNELILNTLSARQIFNEAEEANPKEPVRHLGN